MSTPITEIADWIDDLEFVLEDEKRLRDEEDESIKRFLRIQI